MTKRLFALLLVFCLTLPLFGCGDIAQELLQEQAEQSDALKFKEEYEIVNGTLDDKDQEIRTLSIAEDNPMVYAEYSDIIRMMENGETFVVYFGFSTCPWCRACLETFLQCAADKGVDTVYYADVFNNRDIYEFNENNEIENTKVGSDDYLKLLTLLDAVLDDYELTVPGTNGEEKCSAGEKRIYAPNFIAVVEGQPVCLEESGELMEDAHAELTPEILQELTARYSALFDWVK